MMSSALLFICVKGYLPPIVERHESTLERKRLEYHNYIEQYYSTRHQEIHQETYRQVSRGQLSRDLVLLGYGMPEAEDGKV